MSRSSNYVLAWQDDFNGPLDRSIWQFETGYVRNHELQCYVDSPENVYTREGCLVIEAVRTGNDACPYVSGSVNTKGTVSALYGKIEIRAKLPYGTGIWPAFWTLGCDFPETEWPECGEIDIFEMLGGRGAHHDYLGDSQLHTGLHCPQEAPVASGTYTLPAQSRFADDFHTMGIEWTKTEISWYMDGVLFRSLNIEGIPAFHKPHYLLINLAVGGDWPGAPDEATVFPQRYLVDWVRYYRLEV